MTAAGATAGTARPIDPTEAARIHFVLRFACGTTAAFTICEYMGWQPSALSAVFAGILLGNLPAAPPFKVGFALTLTIWLSAWFAFLLTAYLYQAPFILFGSIALVLFIALAFLAQGKAVLPLTLLLVCIAVIPVITLMIPTQGYRFAQVFARGMMVAVAITWVMHAIWPRPFVAIPPGENGPADDPIRMALAGTAVVLPIILVYQMFGLTDAMPVLTTTTLIVAKMDQERGAKTGIIKLILNFLGGFIAIAAFYALSIAPSLPSFALITFIINFGFASIISKGGARAGAALLGFNATMIIFGLAILKGPANEGVWGARVFQFMVAVLFAIGMMTLLMPPAKEERTRSN
jgi:Protein of unknown function (DUF2955)